MVLPAAGSEFKMFFYLIGLPTKEQKQRQPHKRSNVRLLLLKVNTRGLLRLLGLYLLALLLQSTMLVASAGQTEKVITAPTGGEAVDDEGLLGQRPAPVIGGEAGIAIACTYCCYYSFKNCCICCCRSSISGGPAAAVLLPE